MELFRPGGYFEWDDVPAAIQARAEAFRRLPAAEQTPARPRVASTVLLLRERWGADKAAWSMEGDVRSASFTRDEDVDRVPDNGLEVFMIRRQRSMPTSPNAVVFPGGGFDPRDADQDFVWGGPAPSAWARWLGVPEETARCAVTTAVRELFEETGVLLAGRSDGSIVDDQSDPAWAGHRALLSAHEESLADFLRAAKLELRSDLLCPAARWTTPPYEPKRYDTFFFRAQQPAGQEPDGRTSEAYLAGWVQPRWAFHQFANGVIKLLPPTRHNLARVLTAPSLEAALRPPAGTIRRCMLEPSWDENGAFHLCTRIP